MKMLFGVMALVLAAAGFVAGAAWRDNRDKDRG